MRDRTLEALYVGAGASLGGIARYGVHEIYSHWHVNKAKIAHPPLWGVVGVNIAASFVLGVVAADDSMARKRTLLIGTGFCGGLSTFSTFAMESVKLLKSHPRLFFGYVLASNIGCITAAAGGYAIRKALPKNLSKRLW
mmetsp:Transcript_6523/g.10287  ORF Transcript_6523/g.10287 Transcript_6523/m.10287 type:complete len:139 (-) Transcript_6523:730-1146(-)